jgi:predicted nucleic acid-binding protein
MNVLISADILAEIWSPAPNPRTLAWLDALDEDRAYLSQATIGELQHCICLLEETSLRRGLANWVGSTLCDRFGSHLLPIDRQTCDSWIELMMEAEKAGLSIMEGFMAATALLNDLVLVTHNSEAFEALGLKTFDPATSELPADSQTAI